MTLGALRAPEPLADHHDLGAFDCGVPSLNEWLRRRARAKQASDASRSFVATEGEAGRVVGYYGLASGAVAVAASPGRFRRNMPDPIPVAVPGRLAVDRAWQGRGLWRGLFRDAARRAVGAAEVIGIRGIVVHALSEEARAFYVALGFEEVAGERMTLMVPLCDIKWTVG